MHTSTSVQFLGLTSTQALGVWVRPRRPRFAFEAELADLPRVWHPAGVGPTAFLEAISALAPVVESFFIGDARRLLPRIANCSLRAETEAFLQQEAAHAGAHAAFNRLLARRGVPVQAAERWAQGWIFLLGFMSSDLNSAVAMAGEHFLGELGDVLLTRPEVLAGVDPPIAHLLRWHAYEEVEHKAVLFDAFQAARGDGLGTYLARVAGLWLAVFLVVVILPPMIWRILASKGAAHSPRAWGGVLRFLFGPAGVLRGRGKALLGFMRRDFHPWTYLDNTHHLQALRDAIIDPAWEGAAR